MNEELVEEIREILDDDVKALKEEGKLNPEYFQRIARKDRLIIALASEGARTSHDNSKRLDKAERRIGRAEWVLGGITAGVSFIGAWLLERWLDILGG